MLALDLGVFHRKAHEVSFKEASAWTALWIGLALTFNFIFYKYALWKLASNEVSGALQAKTLGLEFLTGFLIEKSLAVDNIFIFAVVFSAFAIPKMYQHRVLFWGILGALVLRAVFITMGSSLMQYEWLVIVFGVLLVLTGLKMAFSGTAQKDLNRNFVVRVLKRVFKIHPTVDGKNFFVRKNGVLYATPLFIALIFLELTDIVFAVEAVPAIFGITNEPLIVFTSNIFAMLGLRSMYFMLAGVMDRFIYIKYGLAAVLVFVGTKMVYFNKAFGGKFPITWSLLIISTLIGSSIVISLIIDGRKRKGYYPKGRKLLACQNE
jgi:tellurite resistance protein TerC